MEICVEYCPASKTIWGFSGEHEVAAYVDLLQYALNAYAGQLRDPATRFFAKDLARANFLERLDKRGLVAPDWDSVKFLDNIDGGLTVFFYVPGDIEPERPHRAAMEGYTHTVDLSGRADVGEVKPVAGSIDEITVGGKSFKVRTPAGSAPPSDVLKAAGLAPDELVFDETPEQIDDVFVQLGDNCPTGCGGTMLGKPGVGIACKRCGYEIEQ